MLSQLSPVLRLSFCLLLSLGLHGGVFLYGWITSPADSQLISVPVEVSLLPIVDVVPSPTVAPPETLPVLSPSSLRPKSVLKPATPVSKPEIIKPLPKNLAHEEPVEEKQEACLQVEDICVPPTEVAPKTTKNIPEETLLKVSEVDVETQPLPAVSGSSAAISAPPAGPVIVEAIPNYRSNPLPEYPRLARRKHWEGVVWLLVDVAADGSVDDLQVEKSCGHKLLDRAANRTVRRWKFFPATRAGTPVSSQVRIPIRFRLEDG